MSGLYPTPTRLALLRDVAAGNVLDGVTPETDGHTWLVVAPFVPLKVCARIQEMDAAGWVERGEPFWRITEAGTVVLAANGGAS